MKRILAQGEKKIFQLAPSFRNVGEYSPWHHPEFLMLEWYEAGLSFNGLIAQTLELLREVSKVFGVPLCPKPMHITVTEAFKQYACIDLVDGDTDLAAKAVKLKVPSVRANDDFETAYYKILLDMVEPALVKEQCAVLYDYPPSQAALADIQGDVAKRFEIYMHGVELCNGFLELCDADLNAKRFSKINSQREQLAKEDIATDQRFLRDIKHLPACAGNALGFERLLALLCNDQGIDSYIPFRTDFIEK
jgi:lysyl-tRNA synthetase class 2